MKYLFLRDQIHKYSAGAAIATTAEVVGGFIPGVSEIIDATGIITGLATGNFTNAALSAVGLLVPGVSGGTLKATKAAAKETVKQLGSEGAEKLAKAVLNGNISKDALKVISKKFKPTTIKELKQSAKEVLDKAEEAFKVEHGYDKLKIIKEMNRLSSGTLESPTTKLLITDKAILDNIVSNIITEDEKYLDIWYKLLNGTQPWPIILGDPKAITARDVLEAAAWDNEAGRSRYLHVMKGFGDHPGRKNGLKINADQKFGNRIHLTQTPEVASNYTYSRFGRSDLKPYDLLELNKLEENLVQAGYSSKIAKSTAREVKETLKEIEGVLEQGGLKRGKTQTRFAKWTGSNINKPLQYEEFPKEFFDFQKHPENKAIQEELERLHSKLNNILGNREMGLGVRRTGIIRMDQDTPIQFFDWGNNDYLHSGKVIKEFPQLKGTTYDKILENFRSEIPIIITKNIKDPIISGTNVALHPTSTKLLRFSRKQGGQLNYLQYTK